MSAPATSVDARPRDRFGHPPALGYLFATEMWERFSYYGMRALLVLYMVEYLLKPAQAGSVLGLAAFRTSLELVFGPLDVQPLASQIYGFYTGLVYLTPIFGGLLADRVLGQRRTVILGAALMAAGHFLMAFERLFLLALLVLILANGAFKPNISTRSAHFIRPATAAATAPSPSSMSASISAHSSRRWSAAHWANGSAGTGASPLPALA
jgi:POT family proton-dependent oligopeptide transporter